MIANLVNVVIGLWLSYVAIFFGPAGLVGRWSLFAAALAIVALAIIARRRDYSRWQSSTNIVLGVLLLVLASTNLTVALPALVLFWIELWIGLAVAVIALWAALYRPEREQRRPRA